MAVVFRHQRRADKIRAIPARILPVGLFFRDTAASNLLIRGVPWVVSELSPATAFMCVRNSGGASDLWTCIFKTLPGASAGSYCNGAFFTGEVFVSLVGPWGGRSGVPVCM